MFKISLILLIFVLFSAHASEVYQAKIIDIKRSLNKNEPSMVKWSNGSVSFVDNEDEELLRSLKQNTIISFTHDTNQKLIGLSSPVDNSREEVESDLMMSSVYEPTIFESEEEARQVMRGFRRTNLFQFSIQCYNLAHMRAYEAYKALGVKSLKMFVFFTDSYIQRMRFKWWFHVAPMFMVNIDGKVEQRVVDRDWSKKPLLPSQWTLKFMKKHNPCQNINWYSEYELNQDSADCYFLPTNMYYWQPSDLEEYEKTKVERTEFDMSEVNTAFARDA